VKSIERERDRAELLARLARVRPESERLWGTMSSHQMVCHVGDNFRMALGRVKATAPTGLMQRTVVKWIALYAPLRWPPGITTAPELDQQAGAGTRPTDFAADRATAESLLREMAAASLRRTLPHPVFGPMSWAAWLRWGYLHTDHHLRQFGA
jgi:Protein of unknown function (DUF1569)